MRIAQVSPLYESVPPASYGGTERVVSYLTEELVDQGHDVTLFASADSVTRARLMPMCPQALRLSGSCRDSLSYHYLMLEAVFKARQRFDVIHFHIDYLHFLLSRHEHLVHVTTVHGRLDLPELAPLHHEFTDMPLVSISDAQRDPLPDSQWVATVYHGLPLNLYEFRPEAQNYFAFLGRVSPEKGLDRAIEIAQRTGVPLKVAAKVDRADREYFNETIAPLLDSSDVTFVGEIDQAQKNDFLGNARALLFPIDWPEPFGLVMIESLACGTPVVALSRGSVREILDDGETGFMVETVDQAVEAIATRPPLSRQGCRGAFERRFTAPRMAREYVAIYEKLRARPREDAGAFVGGDEVIGRGHQRPGTVLHPGDFRAH